MYKPTEQELLEMGFVKCFYNFHGQTMKNWKNESCPLAYNFIGEFLVIYDGEMERRVNKIQLFPRSKEHLEQIILAFTKPE